MDQLEVTGAAPRFSTRVWTRISVDGDARRDLDVSITGLSQKISETLS